MLREELLCFQSGGLGKGNTYIYRSDHFNSRVMVRLLLSICDDGTDAGAGRTSDFSSGQGLEETLPPHSPRTSEISSAVREQNPF